MARPVAPGLTDHELTIMQLLWDESPLTIQEIAERFPREPKPAYTSLLTAVQSMEKKGVVTHEKEGKAYNYRPVLQKSKYRKSALKRLVGTVFENKPYDLAVSLLKEENLSKTEIANLKKMLEDL